MSHPLIIISQSDSLIKIVDINSDTKWQTVQVQISWLLQKPTDLDLHCLQRQDISGSAGQGLMYFNSWGWSGGAKVLCILHHWGVQLILACSWARPAILVVGKGRGGMFLFLLFLHFHSCSSFFPVPLFHLLYSLFYLFSPFLWETTQNDPQGLTCR